MNFNVVVIGSGLASLAFIDSYLEKNKKIEVISPNFDKSDNNNHFLNSHLYNKKNLPPQMQYNLYKIKDYFHLNNFSVNKNSNILGSLEFGGLSNYWGLQIDPDISKDISCLSKQNSTRLKECFFELAQKLKVIGKFKLN